MLGERPAAEYAVALAAIGALIFVVRAILNYLVYIHNNPVKQNSINGNAIMKSHVEVIASQMDDMVKMWSPDRAKQMTETHDWTKKTLDLHQVYDSEQRPVWWMPAKLDETLKDLLKECRKTNTLLEKFIALNTQEHNIIIRDIRGNLKPWQPNNKK